MTLEEMKARKRELGLSNKEISKRSGVPLGTVQKIFGGVTGAPRMETVIALESVLMPSQDRGGLKSGLESGENVRKDNLYTVDSSAGMPPCYAAEPMPAYKTDPSRLCNRRPGEYTVDDYYAIPADRRVELIDGVIYDMASPSHEHQLISGELSYQLQDFVKKNRGKCRIFTAPFDVQLDGDSRTMVQPDLLVICDKDRINSHGIYGAPDFVIEILSLSTAVTDVTVKLYKYMRAGVREYWIVDPENRQTFVYRKQDEKVLLETYTFNDSVPVGIWDGNCMIDFPDIAKQIDEWIGR